MSDFNLALMFLATHALLCIMLLIVSREQKHRLNFEHYSWILLLPIFGPIAGYSLIRALGRTPSDADWLMHQEEKHRLNIVTRNEEDITVPFEEALLINDPHKRRNLMMNILRSDPIRYLDLLLIARYNDDSETAHYATASIMELQRHFHLEIQQLQLELHKDKTDFAKHIKYVDLLSRYCNSGLLEGQLLHRQQLLLKNALDGALSLEDDPTMLRIKVSNCLALKKAEEAKAAAHMLIKLLPMDESSWLEAMRVYAETRDQEGMRTLLKRIRAEQVDFTTAGREHLNFFGGMLQ